MKHLLLLGGGHSHIEVLRRFGLRRGGGTEITLVNPSPHALYSGMLPGAVAGLYAREECRIDLAALARPADARLICAAATAIDPRGRNVALDNGSTVGYDILSIDVGSAPASIALEGVGKFAIPTRPADGFLAACERLVARTRDGNVARVAVVGGGAAGVEIAFALQVRLRNAGARPPSIALISDQARLLQGHHARARQRVEQALRARGIALHLACRVERINAGAVVTSQGAIATDAVVWATGAAAPVWLAGSGLALDAQGYLAVDAHLQSVSHPGVFAAGDCASIRGHPHPKSGVYAVRQGPVLAENLCRRLQGRMLTPFKPQPRALALISNSDGRAVASYGRFAFEGAWVWRWKDRIDRRFIARYRR